MRNLVVAPKSNSACRIGAVIEREQGGAELPLALTRFATARGVLHATAAMQMATRELLERITTTSTRDAPISVQSLCRACNVTVKGAEQLSSRRDRQWIDRPRRSVHTGEIVFEGDTPFIRLPPHIDFSTARISIAHELGHFLIHSTSASRVTSRLPTSGEEEAVAEYGARLLLMPPKKCQADYSANLAEVALCWSQNARTTLHSAVERLGDPDVGLKSLRGAILWRVGENGPNSADLYTRLEPRWHLCESAFVPIGKCKARRQSLVAAAASECSFVTASAVEEVRIGTFEGVFRVDVVSWGSISEGTRIVLSIFSEVANEVTPGVMRYDVRGSQQVSLI
jgi:hypothetical protein